MGSTGIIIAQGQNAQVDQFRMVLRAVFRQKNVLWFDPAVHRTTAMKHIEGFTNLPHDVYGPGYF